MWLIDEWGVDQFRAEVERQLGQPLQPAAAEDEFAGPRRDHVGIHPQKQAGLNYVGLHVPVGRLFADDLFDLARLAEVYGDGELRLTVEQNVILTHVPDSRLAALQQEPLLEKFSIAPQPLMRSLVSCTGSQFCNFALIETKNRALAMIREVEAELAVANPVRIHWTGCPNSCAQPQVADIGFMGTKVRKNGKTLEGVDIYMGGKVGKEAHLGTCVQKGIPCEDLKPVLRDLLIQQFGAQPKSTTSATQDSPVALVETPGVVAAPATVSFAQSSKSVPCNQDNSILEVAEQAGVAIDSSCRSGNCGTCKQKLVSGEIRYDGEPNALDGDDRAQGYILTCIAHPINQVAIDC